MKISRLYLKIYFYFLLLIFISFIILIPLIFFFSVDRPYKNIAQKRMIIMASVMESLLFNRDLKTALSDISIKTNSDVALYDSHGQAKVSSGENPGDLDEKVMKKARKEGFYTDVSRKEDRVFVILPLSSEKSPYSYMSFRTDFGSQKERNNRFFIWLIFLCVMLSILIYPLAMHITGPLERITQKAIKFSEGDFSRLEEEKGKSVFGDEISRMDSAFTHMAGELVRMIEEKKELLSDISHELGSPLSRIKVAAEIIEDKIDSGKVPSAEVVKGLSADIDEMSNLVKELLEFSKILNLEITKEFLKPLLL